MTTVGIDLVEIDRITDIITKTPRFLTRFFGNEEYFLFASKSKATLSQTVAGNFAAKEAFAKALGTGIVGFALSEVMVLRDSFGAPYIKTVGKAAALCTGCHVAVSISHTKSHATAIVLIEPAEGGAQYVNADNRADETCRGTDG